MRVAALLRDETIPVDLIFAHSDLQLLYALEATEDAGLTDTLHFIGCGGQKEVIRLVMDGVVTATAKRTNEFPQALDLALQILRGRSVEWETILPWELVTEENAGSFYDPYSVF